MNIEQEKQFVLRIMNLALMKFSLLPCGLKHIPFFLSAGLKNYVQSSADPSSCRQMCFFSPEAKSLLVSKRVAYIIIEIR